MPVEPILPLYITDFVSSSSQEQRKALIKLLEDQDSYLTAGSDSNLSDGEFNSSRKSEIPSGLEPNSLKNIVIFNHYTTHIYRHIGLCYSY